MLNAIRYARENIVPYFGICLGMQTACIEFARNVCGLQGANSSEFDPATPHRIIYKLRELIGVEEMGGTMRLGAWTCMLAAGLARRPGLRRRHGNLRTPPPSLRIQPRVRSAAHRRRPAHHRHHARRHLRRDRRDSRPSLLSRLPVPPRIQIQAARAAPALPRLHHRQLRQPSIHSKRQTADQELVARR